MKKLLLASAVVLLAYLLLGEVAWRNDFMAALGEGRPLTALAEVCFFGLRVVLLVAGPSLLAALVALWLWRRLTNS